MPVANTQLQNLMKITKVRKGSINFLKIIEIHEYLYR